MQATASKAQIASVRLVVGMEVHIELATRTKMFTRVGNPAHEAFEGAEPNTLIDPVVLGLPGALPVLNKEAIDHSILVGLSLGCSIAPFTKWDRKSYFYPDLPKNYQISQYDLPLCFDGSAEYPDPADADGLAFKQVGIIRAHLEEDAGKLLHEAPGGQAIDFSIADYNRAGTPLLEVVTAPEFTSADDAVSFAMTLRDTCRFLGVTRGIMQKGHMRFEPNINCVLTMSDGTLVVTPIVEVKNLNSFKSLKGAIEYELAEQPRRYLEDGRVMSAGAKRTRGWDDAKGATFLQREKEDAHDYRYFPDPDLPPVRVTPAWRDEVAARLPEPPHRRARRYREEFGIGPREAAALVEEREVCFFFESAIEAVCAVMAAQGVQTPGPTREHAAKLAANFVLQSGFKRANERRVLVSELGISPGRLAGVAVLREKGLLSAAAADELFGHLCGHDEDPEAAAGRLGLLQVRDEGALAAWVAEVISDPANAKAVADVRAGKMAAMGRLVGEVMKRSAGKADAQAVRQQLTKELS